MKMKIDESLVKLRDDLKEWVCNNLKTRAKVDHTHEYAGSSSVGGSANSAVKLDSSAGSATQPVYFSNGKPVACTNTLGKSVPSDAKFTDTTYSNATTSAAGLMSSTDKTKLNGIAEGANKYSHPTTSGNKHIPAGGSNGQILRWSADGTAVWDNENDTNTTYDAAGSSLGLVKTGGDVTISNGIISVNDDSHNHTIANIDDLQTILNSKWDIANYGTIIPSNADLDTYIIPGNYYSENSTKSKTITNTPVTDAGFTLAVIKGYTSTCIYHVVMGYGNTFKFRVKNGDTWFEWIDITKDTTYNAATTSAAGLMTAAMVTKLNGITEGANKYSHPTTSGNKHIPSGGALGQILRWSADGTAVWGNENNTTYTGANGISLSGTTFSNSGVRSISTGSSNGTISVNTNGSSANVAVKGLTSAAFTEVDSTVTKGSTKLVTSGAVESKISDSFSWKEWQNRWTNISELDEIMTLPEKFTELMICVDVDYANKDTRGNNLVISNVIPSFIFDDFSGNLSDIPISYRFGYFQVGNKDNPNESVGSCAIIKLQFDNIQISNVFLNGKNVTQNSRWCVYYR